MTTGPDNPATTGERLPTRRLRADEIADAIYLATHLSDTAMPSPSDHAAPPPESPPPPPEATDASSASESSDSAAGQLSSPPPRLDAVVEPTADGAGHDVAGEPDWHNGFGLTGQRSISRALRPFKRTELSATLTELDEEETANNAAVQRRWLPYLRHAQDRAMEVVLVVDAGESMVLWRRTATELRVLLERQAAFSTVRGLQLDTDRTGSLWLRGEAASGARRSPAELLDPTGRRLVLLLTDGIGAAWRDGLVQQWLGRWGRCGPVAVLHVLPRSLWHWSRIRPTPVRLHAAARRVANSRLRCDLVPDGARIPVPVLELDERTLGPWARLVAEPGANSVRLPALLVSTGPTAAESADEPVDDDDQDALHRVLRFRAAASTTAFRLARLLAAAPLNLPVMTLVQRFMLPDARGAHLAEVFLSGLLTRIDDEITDVGTVGYDFKPGVRQELLAAGSRRDTALVVRLVADRLGPRVAAVRGLREALRSPDTAPHPDLRSPSARRFATVEQAVMTALGGDYSRRGKALRAALGAFPQTSSPANGEPRERPVHDPKGAIVDDGHNDLATAAHPGATPPHLPRPRRRPGDFPPIWGNVPLRNANFTGREELLRRLSAQLDSSAPTAVLPEALHGMGGVGKTLIAVEYVYRHLDDYDLVWWIPSEDPALIQSSFVELADRMGLATADPSPQVAVPAVLAELRNPSLDSRWLVVFDNADRPEDLRGFLPQGPGHVIVTSRNPEWANLARALEVDVFERTESVELLQRRCPELTHDEAGQLAEVLGDLPLALEQAGAWCAATGMPVPEYLELFERQRAELLRAHAPIDYPVTVAAAWNVSLDRLRQDSPQALLFVQLCSCFAPEPIRRGIFSDLGDAAVPPELAEPLRRPIELGRAIREVKRYSLARVDYHNDTVQLHRIVRAVVQDQMTPTEQARMRHIAHLLLLKTDPRLPGVPKHWPVYSSLQPHVRAARAIDCDDTDVRRLVVNQAVFLNAWGDYQASYETAEEARRVWHERFGERDLDTLSAARRVGTALRNLGRFQQARHMDERTLSLLRETVGDDHEETLILAGLVSSDLRAIGDFHGARRLNEDTLERSARTLGPNDENTLYAQHNLAIGLRLTGDFAQARIMDEQVWDGRRTMFGDDDRFTLMSLDAIALDERLLGNHAEACRLGENVVAAHRLLLTGEHPQTLTAIANLAVARRKAGDHVGALELSTEALRGFRKRLGDDHPETMAAAMNVSIDRRHADDLPVARTLGERSLDRYRGTLGEQHPFTSAAATNLAVSVRLMGVVEEAERLDRLALRHFRAALGVDHPFTLVAATNLASDLAAAGDHQAALELDADTHARSRRTLGDRHPSTLAVALNHALDLASLRRDDEAEAERTPLLDRFRNSLGPAHPATGNAENRLRADCDIEPITII
ncbi:FxSxx-COOH system tetratricopeptide repeat protein [Kutzneria sp. NPDC052558]|uniref:FxSxx-COOH system tetratricopeptide repeat protein n=1 Tax=Kutzneria sp. NPDC052558 TaxID=3364121 RepID=UPI0037C727C6